MIVISTAWCQRCPTWEVNFADHQDLAESYAAQHRNDFRGHKVFVTHREVKGYTYRVPKDMGLFDHRGKRIPRGSYARKR